MSRPARFLVAACAAAFAASASLATPPERVNIEYRAWESDLIVVGEVLTRGQPERTEADLHDGRPGAKWVRRYRVRTARVIKATREALGDAAGPNALVGREVVALDRCAPPGAPRPRVGRWATLPEPLFRIGGEYLLMLIAMPEGGYAVRKFPAPHYKQLATDEAVREMEVLADPVKWPWGPADGRGLQLALIARPVSSSFGKRTMLTVSVFVAVRNTSQETRTLSVYRGDEYLSVRGRAPDGERHVHDFYRLVDANELPPFAPRDVVELPAGGWFVLSPFGSGRRGPEPMYYATFIRMPMARGKWTFQASYRVAQARTLDGGRQVWTGEITSRPMAVWVGPKPTATTSATTTSAPASAPAEQADPNPAGPD